MEEWYLKGVGDREREGAVGLVEEDGIFAGAMGRLDGWMDGWTVPGMWEF